MLFLNYPLINTNVGMSKDNAKTVMLTPENIVVYLSSTLRLHSSSYTPYFRNVNSKKDTQSFFESPLPTSR